ncbi:MAG: hypothetical protein AAB425_08905, partial [Bdellovibrionota bacterium]
KDPEHLGADKTYNSEVKRTEKAIFRDPEIVEFLRQSPRDAGFSEKVIRSMKKADAELERRIRSGQRQDPGPGGRILRCLGAAWADLTGLVVGHGLGAAIQLPWQFLRWEDEYFADHFARFHRGDWITIPVQGDSKKLLVGRIQGLVYQGTKLMLEMSTGVGWHPTLYRTDRLDPLLLRAGVGHPSLTGIRSYEVVDFKIDGKIRPGRILDFTDRGEVKIGFIDRSSGAEIGIENVRINSIDPESLVPTPLELSDLKKGDRVVLQPRDHYREFRGTWVGAENSGGISVQLNLKAPNGEVLQPILHPGRVGVDLTAIWRTRTEAELRTLEPQGDQIWRKVGAEVQRGDLTTWLKAQPVGS